MTFAPACVNARAHALPMPPLPPVTMAERPATLRIPAQLREPQRWSGLSLPTMSIGQEVSVTALQMVAAPRAGTSRLQVRHERLGGARSQALDGHFGTP